MDPRAEQPRSWMRPSAIMPVGYSGCSECHRVPCTVTEKQLPEFSVCGCSRVGLLVSSASSRTNLTTGRTVRRRRLPSMNQRNDRPGWPLPEASSSSWTQCKTGCQFYPEVPKTVARSEKPHETSQCKQPVGTMSVSLSSAHLQQRQQGGSQDCSHCLLKHIQVFVFVFVAGEARGQLESSRIIH